MDPNTDVKPLSQTCVKIAAQTCVKTTTQTCVLTCPGFAIEYKRDHTLFKFQGIERRVINHILMGSRTFFHIEITEFPGVGPFDRLLIEYRPWKPAIVTFYMGELDLPTRLELDFDLSQTMLMCENGSTKFKIILSKPIRELGHGDSVILPSTRSGIPRVNADYMDVKVDDVDGGSAISIVFKKASIKIFLCDGRLAYVYFDGILYSICDA